jgi:hypothetical protein
VGVWRAVLMKEQTASHKASGATGSTWAQVSNHRTQPLPVGQTALRAWVGSCGDLGVEGGKHAALCSACSQDPTVHHLVLKELTLLKGTRTMLQAGRSRVREPTKWIFFNLPNPSGRTRPWGLLGL